MTSPTNAEIVVADLARRAGRTLTSDDAQTLAGMLASAGRFVPGQPVTVETNGASVGAEEWFAAQTPWLTASARKEAAAPPTATGTRTERSIAQNAARNSAEGKLAEAERLFHNHGNPWKHGPTFNRSRSGFIALHNPVLAERLRSEAVL